MHNSYAVVEYKGKFAVEGPDGSLSKIEVYQLDGTSESVVRTFGTKKEAESFIGSLPKKGADGHIADWELRGPKGGKITSGTETSGVDFALEKGYKLTFYEQSLYGHTEGNIIDGLIDAGKIKPGSYLLIEGIKPPCSNCRKIMKEKSAIYNMVVEYVDSAGDSWRWVNGVLN